MKKKESTEETLCSKQKMENLSKWKTQQRTKAKIGNEAKKESPIKEHESWEKDEEQATQQWEKYSIVENN